MKLSNRTILAILFMASLVTLFLGNTNIELSGAFGATSALLILATICMGVRVAFGD